MNDLVPLLLKHGPLLVFVVTLAARAGAPLPAAPLLVVAGGLGALGQIPLALTAGLSLLANLLGDIVWFVAGRKLGYRVLRVLCRISLSPDTCVRQSEDLFGRWGGVSLVGFAAAGLRLKVGDEAMAGIDESAVVVAIPG